MSNLDRIATLQAFTLEEPENPFNFYALALEYRELDKPKAAHLFDYLLETFPNYLPTYFSAAQLFSEEDLMDKAKQTLESGIALASVLKEEKTKKELTNAYQNLLFESGLE